MSFNELDVSGNKYTREFHRLLKSYDIDFATGVPCGVLRHFIVNFDNDPNITHIPSLNEREAIGIAAGTWLAGKSPAVYMQNSGMFVASNDIGSLLIPCRIPVLMVVSYRGCPGENAPQHLTTGKATKPLLDSLGLFYAELEEECLDIVSIASSFMEKREMPAVILVRRGWTKTESRKDRQEEVPESTDKMSVRLAAKIHNRRLLVSSMTREEAIDAVMAGIRNNVALISSTGLISRSLYDRYDSENQFYNAGGFGLTSAIGFGFAVSKSRISTVVVEGDASLLTNPGNMITIGHFAPANLTHIILDNQAYASCSEEPSLSCSMMIAETAAIRGYRNIFSTNSYQQLQNAVKESQNLDGPNFIHVRIKLGGRRDLARPLDMAYIAKRFRRFFKN